MWRLSILSALLTLFALRCFGAEEESYTSQIHRAIANAKNDAAQELLIKHPELLEAQEPQFMPSQSDGFTPLHTAVSRGNIPMARWLIAHGADINAPALGKTKDGREFGSGHTPLESAAHFDQLQSVEFLILARARVSGTSEVHLALLNGNRAIAKYLLDHGGKGDIFSAASLGEINELKKILQNHPDVEVRAEHGFTPLHFAAICGQMETIKLLLAGKAKIDAEATATYADNGDTPLVLAIRHGHSELARFLIQAGADVNLNGGDSALSEAVDHDDLPTLQALLERHARIEQRDLYGQTPLLAAIKLKNRAMVAVLLENGADPNAKEEASRLPNSTDPTRDTALDLAVQSKSKALCELLLNSGAKLHNESNEALKDVLTQPATEPALIRK